MRWLLLVGLAGCNQTFGLEHTQIVDAADAAFFDVREDFTCPPIGETPKFSPAFTTIADRCVQYSESKQAGRASALCSHPASGPLDGPFVGIANLADDRYGTPHLAPEGDVLYVRDNTTDTLLIFTRTGADAFAQSGTVIFPPGTGIIHVGGPANGGRMVWGRAANVPPPVIQEVVIGGDGTITPVTTHDVQELGVEVFAGAPNLTADGLRMVFPARFSQTEFHVAYTDRMKVGDPFRPARVLEDIPFEALQTPYLNETCSRIYFKSGTQLVWSQRIE